MGIRSIVQLRRAPLTALLCFSAISLLSAKKEQPVLEWKNGILWEAPDGCNDASPIWNETFLILGDDTLYHLAHSTLIGRKPNVTEGAAVQYAVAQGEFYLQDDDGRVFKLSVVKKEVDPKAQQRLKSGKLPCQP
jgi:hypothetical protein